MRAPGQASSNLQGDCRGADLADVLALTARRPDTRTVIVVAHPDDEVLGAGGSLADFGDVHIVHVTDGVPRRNGSAAEHGFPSAAAYAAARRDEAVAALAVAGLPSTRLTGLGFGDQEAAWNLVALVDRLRPHLRGADRVITHAFEGGHADHDAVAFAVHACIRSRDGEPQPALIEMPFYFGDDHGWVRQRFLPHPGAGAERVVKLDAAQRVLKQRMLAAHRSQADTLRDFDIVSERFRQAPDYDFGHRPHPGPLLYERHGWNLTWDDWRAQVAAASVALGLHPR